MNSCDFFTFYKAASFAIFFIKFVIFQSLKKKYFKNFTSLIYKFQKLNAKKENSFTGK